MAHTETNYRPDPRGSEVITPLRYGTLGNLYGPGDPNTLGVRGRTGWSFYDTSSDSVYYNTGTGYSTTWTLFAGGTSGDEFPVGAVVAWLQDFTGTPALPDDWVECNGQVLSDAESPYDGQTIPDLNGNQYFLRGAAISGGGVGQTAHAHSAGASFEVTTTPGSGAFAWDANAQSSAETAFAPDHYTVVWIMKVK